MTDFLVPLTIGLIMFGIGLNTSWDSFKRVFTKPRAVLVGLALQLILLPATGLLIALIWPMEPIYQFGLVLIAACPGGTSSNLVTHLLKGKIELSVTLTAFNSFLVILTIPLILNTGSSLLLGHEQHIAIPFARTMKQIAFTVGLPVLLGTLVQANVPHLANKLRKPLRWILPTLLLMVFALVAFDFFQRNIDVNGRKLELMLPALTLNACTMVVGFALAGRLKLEHRSRLTVAIEMGLQNSALAIFVADSLIGNPNLTVMPILYSSITFFSTIAIALVFRKHFS